MNPHGFAIYELNTNTLTKTFDKNIVKEILSKETPYIAHCRFKTQGEVNLENIHLFEWNNWLVAMNGTIGGLKDKTTNDTIQLIKMLTLHIKKDKIVDFLEMWEARVLLYNRKTKVCIKTGNWFEKNKVFYSKDNVFEEKKIYNYNGSNNNRNTYNNYQKNISTTTDLTNVKTFSYEPTECFNYYCPIDSKWYAYSAQNLNYLFIDPITIEKLGFSIKSYIEAEDPIKAATLVGYKPFTKTKKKRVFIAGISEVVDVDEKPTEGSILTISDYGLYLLENKLSNSCKQYKIKDILVKLSDSKIISTYSIMAVI